MLSGRARVPTKSIGISTRRRAQLGLNGGGSSPEMLRGGGCQVLAHGSGLARGPVLKGERESSPDEKVGVGAGAWGRRESPAAGILQEATEQTEGNR